MAFDGKDARPPLMLARDVAMKIATHPFIIATVAGFLAAGTGFKPPPVLQTMIDNLAQAAAPCALFAMGVTLYQALTGRLPYGQIERFQTPVFHPAKRLSKINPNIPSWLEAVIHRAIAIKPARRYQHYSELAHDLSHPERVQPFYEADTPLIERNPVAFYKTGFFFFLLTTIWLAFKLLSQK